MKSVTIIFTVLWISQTNGHKNGADSAACNDLEMKPQHPNGVSTKNEGAFEVRILPQEYDPLNPSEVGVQIISSNGTLFKGFLIQARKYQSFDPIAKGVMDGPSSLTGKICGRAGNGMTHTSEFSNNWKPEISLNWSPYSDVCDNIEMGDLWFQLTVVKSLTEKAQVNIFSPILKMKNVTDPDIIQRCKDKVNGGTIGHVSLFLVAGLLLLQRL